MWQIFGKIECFMFGHWMRGHGRRTVWIGRKSGVKCGVKLAKFGHDFTHAFYPAERAVFDGSGGTKCRFSTDRSSR